MPTAIGAVGAAAPEQMHGSVDSAMSALGGMDSEGFLQLLVAQLQYQSPLEPKDPGDLMTQTAALAQLDATQQMLAAQQRELGLQQAVKAVGLLGHEITGTGADGLSIQGEVEGIRYTTAGPILLLEGGEVALSNLTQVRRLPPPGPEDTGLIAEVPEVSEVPGTPTDADATDGVADGPGADGAPADPEATEEEPDPADADPTNEAAT